MIKVVSARLMIHESMHPSEFLAKRMHRVERDCESCAFWSILGKNQNHPIKLHLYGFTNKGKLKYVIQNETTYSIISCKSAPLDHIQDGLISASV